MGSLKNRKWIGLLFVLPAAIAVLLMMVYPMLQVIVFSFSKIKLPTFQTEFIGLKNFITVINKREMAGVVRNTVVWTLSTMTLRVGLGFIAALVMESKLKGMKVLRTCALIPWVIPSIVASNTWRWIYSPDYGLLNMMVKNLGISGGMNWLGKTASALPCVIIANSWAGFPFNMLMIVAALQAIPSDYIEAARIDGANTWQVFRHITLPSLRQILSIIIMLEFINGVNSFDMLYTMTGGGPGTASETIALTIWRYAFRDLNFANGSALSLIVIGIMIICFLFYVPMSAKGQDKKN